MLNDCLETWWNWLYVTNRDTFPDHQTSWGNIYITFIHDKNLFKNFCLIIYKKTNGFWGKVNIFFSVYRWHYMIRCHYLLCRRNTHDSILWWNENYQLYMSHPTLSPIIHIKPHLISKLAELSYLRNQSAPKTGAWVAQWDRSLDLTTHKSLSPIQRGFALGFVNYKKGCTRLAAASDKVYQLLAHGRWFSPGTPASSTTKTGRHDIAEILLKVALNTKIKSNQKHFDKTSKLSIYFFFFSQYQFYAVFH